MSLDVVNGVLAKLADDADLHDDLKQPQVQVAMRHWTAQERLPPDQAEKLMGDYRVMAVLQKIKLLQTECQRAGIPVPLDAVMRRDRALRLPGGGGGAGAGAAKQQEKEKEKEGGTKAAKRKGKGKEAAKEPGAHASAPAPASATTTTAAAAATEAAGQRKVRRPPQTLFEWLHLLSPLLTLVFGILYALARALGTGSGGSSK